MHNTGKKKRVKSSFFLKG